MCACAILGSLLITGFLFQLAYDSWVRYKKNLIISSIVRIIMFSRKKERTLALSLPHWLLAYSHLQYLSFDWFGVFMLWLRSIIVINTDVVVFWGNLSEMTIQLTLLRTNGGCQKNTFTSQRGWFVGFLFRKIVISTSNRSLNVSEVVFSPYSWITC
jgi:hypothetical protein